MLLNIDYIRSSSSGPSVRQEKTFRHSEDGMTAVKRRFTIIATQNLDKTKLAKFNRNFINQNIQRQNRKSPKL